MNWSTRTTVGLSAILLMSVVATGAVASNNQETAGIETAELVTTADADGDGFIAAGTLEVTLDTKCVGCYDRATLVGDPEMEPQLEIQLNGTRVVTIEPERQETLTLQWTLGELVDVVDHKRANISVTLYEQDATNREIVDSAQLRPDVESPAADTDSEATTATPERGHPPTGDVRRTPHFNFRYDGVERCGMTCAAATGTVWPAKHAVQQPLSNVTVDVRLRSGTTVVWRDSKPVGQLHPGETHTTTQRANPQVAALRAVSANDGRIALIVEIRSDQYHEIVTYERIVTLPL